MKHIVSFSGGVGSYCAARRVIAEHGKDDTVLVFCDTLIEDEDLYRFIDDAVAVLGCEYIRLADGRTPWELFRDRGFISNSRIAHCSQYLKSMVFYRYLAQNYGKNDCIVYLGIDWNESHRLQTARKRRPSWTIEAPLTEPPYLDKQGMLKILKDDGIKIPRLYNYGFPHNNCSGGCVRAGLAQWRLLYKSFPEKYEYFAERESYWKQFQQQSHS